MVDAMRAMLDELMGKERNVPLDKRSNKRIRFDDPTVCKFALAGLCPYGLFKNTRSDLGELLVGTLGCKIEQCVVNSARLHYPAQGPAATRYTRTI